MIAMAGLIGFLVGGFVVGPLIIDLINRRRWRRTYGRKPPPFPWPYWGDR